MLKVEIRAEFLKSAMLEDRNEIRLIRGWIYQLSTLITVSSFGVTSFLLARTNGAFRHPRTLCAISDVSFLALLWVSFALLEKDLWCARKCLEKREDMIRNLTAVAENDPFDPFPKVALDKPPRLKERSIFLILVIASAALIVKLGFLVGFAT